MCLILCTVNLVGSIFWNLVIHVDSGCLNLRKSDFAPAFGLRGYWMPGMRKSPYGMRKSPYGHSHCHPREESPKAR